jgi:hypothetical protein
MDGQSRADFLATPFTRPQLYFFEELCKGQRVLLESDVDTRGRISETTDAVTQDIWSAHSNS